jgi:hypothetical protein
MNILELFARATLAAPWLFFFFCLVAEGAYACDLSRHKEKKTRSQKAAAYRFPKNSQLAARCAARCATSSAAGCAASCEINRAVIPTAGRQPAAA